MKTIHVSGTEQFRISVPDDAKVYLGPLVPKKEIVIPEGAKITNFYANEQQYNDGRSTPSYALHVEDAEGNKIACIPGATGFRDLSIDFTLKIASEEGSTIWKSDNEGYSRQENIRKNERWHAETDKPVLPTPRKRK